MVRRSEAKAPAGFNRQRQWRLKTIRLVLPKPKEPRDSRAFWFWRFGLGETAESGSTKCDYEHFGRQSAAEAPAGVRTREASALETIRLVLPPNPHKHYISGENRQKTNKNRLDGCWAAPKISLILQTIGYFTVSIVGPSENKGRNKPTTRRTLLARFIGIAPAARYRRYSPRSFEQIFS